MRGYIKASSGEVIKTLLYQGLRVKLAEKAYFLSAFLSIMKGSIKASSGEVGKMLIYQRLRAKLAEST